MGRRCGQEKKSLQGLELDILNISLASNISNFRKSLDDLFFVQLSRCEEEVRSDIITQLCPTRLVEFGRSG